MSKACTLRKLSIRVDKVPVKKTHRRRQTGFDPATLYCLFALYIKYQPHKKKTSNLNFKKLKIFCFEFVFLNFILNIGVASAKGRGGCCIIFCEWLKCHFPISRLTHITRSIYIVLFLSLTNTFQSLNGKDQTQTKVKRVAQAVHKTS